MSHYRNTDFTIFNMCNSIQLNYYQQCEVAYNNQSKRIWVPNVVLEDALNDLFLEFTDNNGVWDGVAWRVLNISPEMNINDITESHTNGIKLLTVSEVRNYKKWN